MAELLTTCSSLRLQAVGACVIALAERLDLHEVAALDRRAFQLVAPRCMAGGLSSGEAVAGLGVRILAEGEDLGRGDAEDQA